MALDAPPREGRPSLAPDAGERWHVERIFRGFGGGATSGARINARRVQNLVQGNYDEAYGRVEMRAFPIKLTVEATNICNLRCPGCFTGIEQIGRTRGHMSLELFQDVLRELGPYLFEVEFY